MICSSGRQGPVVMSKGLLIETLLLMGLATLGIYDGARLLRIHIPHDPLGPGGFLLIISIMLVICSVINLWVHYEQGATAEGKRFSLHIGQVGQAVIVYILYAIAVPLVGYLLGSVFFFVLMVRIFGETSWIRTIVFGLIFAVVFKIGFSSLMEIPIP